ncbi:adhesion G protein-coupled receptor E2-like isoform X2 [Dendronephthya gigantea]|uniref:adhesion G protein-coupled receptor E2-like isoform X2 n=1 Tax=Dendronephthya gigantea TaxID=151771 RepID=UPI00106AB17E|nr:adhesion G protein-coupled receptor E2-like isoform X2 [Dendronephthya gigantea]
MFLVEKQVFLIASFFLCSLAKKVSESEDQCAGGCKRGCETEIEYLGCETEIVYLGYEKNHKLSEKNQEIKKQCVSKEQLSVIKDMKVKELQKKMCEEIDDSHPSSKPTRNSKSKCADLMIGWYETLKLSPSFEQQTTTAGNITAGEISESCREIIRCFYNITRSRKNKEIISAGFHRNFGKAFGEKNSKFRNQPQVFPKAYSFRKRIKEMVQLVNSTCDDESFKVKNGSCEMDVVVLSSLENQNGLLPRKSLLKLCRNQSKCTVKIMTIRMKNVTVDTSYLWKSLPLAFSDVISLDYIANGQLLSTLENETISLSFPNKLKKNVARKQVKCMFLDGEKWKDENMSVGSVNEDNITCLTDHLTSFTMVILSKADGVSDSDRKAIAVISYIGSGLSLAGLMFSCVVYIVLYKDLKMLTTSRHLVHFNLQIALGLTQMIFLAGGVATQNKVVCKVVAILVHYFSLASFVWILLEAAMLYLKLISVYSGEFVRIKKFMIFGWGFPFVYVGCIAGLQTNKYGTIKQWCWISYEEGLSWVFFAPVVITLSVTIVVVIAVARVVFHHSNTEGHDTKKKIISAARGIIILFPTLGLSWAFGVIARYSTDVVVWQYLFAIFTSMQGFLIFLIYGVCNREIRKAVGRKMGYEVNPTSGLEISSKIRPMIETTYAKKQLK